MVDEITERALDAALKQKDTDKNVEIVVVTMGPHTAVEALRKSLSMGADRAIHVQDDALGGADVLTTARVLAEAVRSEGFDLVVAGNDCRSAGTSLPWPSQIALLKPFTGYPSRICQSRVLSCLDQCAGFFLAGHGLANA